MELYVEPTWVKKDTRFKKGHATWNKGRKGFSTQDPEKQRLLLQNLAEGRRNLWKTRRRDIAWNSKPICAYDLDGNFVGVYKSACEAARALGQHKRNVRRSAYSEGGRCGQYQFRWAKLVEFQGELLVKKTPIEPYKRRNHYYYNHQDPI